MNRNARRLCAATVALAGLTVAPTGPATADDAALAIVAEFTPPDGELNAVLVALADGSINGDIPPLAVGQVVPAPVSTGYVNTAEDLPGFDVTAKPQGQAEIAAFVERLRVRGEVPHAVYRVFSLPDVVAGDPTHPDLPVDTQPVDDLREGEGPLSSSIVVPGCVTPELVGAVIGADARISTTTVFTTLPRSSLGCDHDPGAIVGNATGTDEPATGTGWTPAGGLGCVSRKQNRTAWYDPCSWWYHRSDDGNGQRDTYGLDQYGTGKSKTGWTLDLLEVRSWRKTGTPDQDWLDWSPRADSDAGNCRSETVGVSVYGATLENTSQHCDVWDIDKGEEPADFANDWDGSAKQKERDTASMIATNVPNGYVPTDYVRFDYYA